MRRRGNCRWWGDFTEMDGKRPCLSETDLVRFDLPAAMMTSPDFGCTMWEVKP